MAVEISEAQVIENEEGCDKWNQEQQQLKNKKKKSEDMIASLYRYSDLSVQAIAHKVNMNPNEVQKMIDDIVKSNALEVLVEQSTTRVEKIMTSIVIVSRLF